MAPRFLCSCGEHCPTFFRQLTPSLPPSGGGGGELSQEGLCDHLQLESLLLKSVSGKDFEHLAEEDSE